ncbi:MAG: sortase [Thermomicrobiales bacterium]
MAHRPFIPSPVRRVRLRSRRGHDRYRRGSPLFTAFTILALLVGAISPVFDGVAFAQTVTPDGSSGAGDSDVQGTQAPQDQPTQPEQQPTQPDQTQPTVDTSMQTPTETPTPTVENELLGAVNIAYWECPPADPANPPLIDPSSICTQQRNGVTFAITDGQGNTQTQETGYYDDSQIGFTEIPIGAITFGQTTPPFNALVLCNGIVQHGGPETGIMQLSVSNGMVSWNLKDDEIVFCNWYVTPIMTPAASATQSTGETPTATVSTGMTETPTAATTGGVTMTPDAVASGTPVNQLVGSINITYRECPSTFDLTNPPSDPATACTTMRNGVQFDLTASTSQTFSQLTGYYDDSVVSFTEIPTGNTTVTQNPAAGQTLVICDGIVQHGGPETGDMTMPVTNGSITWDLKDDEIVGCNWYTNGVSGTAAEPASFAISAFTCPSGFNLNASDEATTATTCTTSILGLRFDLGPSGGTGNPMTVLTGNDGSAGFGDVVPGSYTLKRYPVPSNSFIYCHSATNPQYPFTASVLGGFDISLDPGVAVTCAWYETPAAAGTGTVVINKHACPASYVPSSPPDIYDLAANCHDDAGPTSFVVTYGQTSVPGTTSGSPNLLEMDNVPSGLVIVTENAVQGYGAPIVTCKGMSLTNDPTVEVPSTLMTVTANTITWNLVDTQTMFCDWFNMPSGYGSITINKLACPAGYAVANPADPYDIALKCHENAGPVNFTVTNGAYSTTGTTSGSPPNLLSVSNVPSGAVTLTETIPTGYAQPVVFCRGSSVTNDPDLEVPYGQQQVNNGTITWNLLPDQMLYCDWINIPMPPTFSVIIYKYTCGDDPTAYMTNGVPDYQKFTTLCTHPLPGVPFTASQSGSPVATATSSNSNPFSLSNLPVTTTTVAETIPSGYGEPYVFCGDAYSPTLQMVMNGAITLNPGGSGPIVCSWYNMPDGPGSITVYKWLCPAGYDWTLPGADPKMDCATPQDGVTFSLYDSTNTKLGQTDTGDSIPYAIYYGGLQIGDYSLKETVPDGIGGVFVLDCTGLYTGSIHPAPLWTGNDFPFHVGSHDQIVCNWYNVPYADHGGIVIHKSMCTTLTWVSTVECDTWEYGASFTVSNGGGTVDQGTTDAWGKLSVDGLDAGNYTVTETSGTPCHVEASVGGGQSSPVTNGAVTVEGGKTTDVWVYNCSTNPTPGATKPPTSGKPPMKYPNTGRQDTQVIEPEMATPPSAPNELGTPQACASFQDGTPVAATPEEGVRCGAVPVSIAATAIGLSAKVEILETVNGDMEDPTTPDQAAWYKETAKLGGAGNTVMAGHLNYWGVPEGVFFAIDQLKAGDSIVVTGNDGTVYTYVVDWVKQVDATVAPGDDIVGETAQPSLTLMTCGGPWNSDVSEYTERTVVRAHLVGTGPAPEATPES